jgi:hypothetical protein
LGTFPAQTFTSEIVPGRDVGHTEFAGVESFFFFGLLGSFVKKDFTNVPDE